VTEYVPRAPPS
jgi:hypothetical protein